jgi:molybdopterin-guanine dinucleotide biosynthesis protein A
VLVRGRSSRMGRDKALLPFRGHSLAQCIAAAAVAQSAGTAMPVGSPELYSGIGFPVISDLFPGEGPLSGILTALRYSKAEWNLIAACEMPEIDAGLLTRLLDAARQFGADVLLPVTAEGRPQPLCSVYRGACLAPLESAFSAGTRKVTAALAAVRCARLSMEEVSQFQNVNTPEDWAAYVSG